MPHNIIKQLTIDTIGLTLTGTTVAMSAVEVLSSIYVNEGLHLLASVGALVFLYYKIKNSRLDSKLKQRDLNKKPKK